jgi:hypothetical protein
LTNIEWSRIRVIKEFLEKLLILTKTCESQESIFDLFFPCTNYILVLFEYYKNKYKNNPTFIIIFNSSWKKINKYYEFSDKTPAYIIIIVLYPGRK